MDARRGGGPIWVPKLNLGGGWRGQECGMNDLFWCLWWPWQFLRLSPIHSLRLLLRLHQLNKRDRDDDGGGLGVGPKSHQRRALMFQLVRSDSLVLLKIFSPLPLCSGHHRNITITRDQQPTATTTTSLYHFTAASSPVAVWPCPFISSPEKKIKNKN